MGINLPWTDLSLTDLSWTDLFGTGLSWINLSCIVSLWKKIFYQIPILSKNTSKLIQFSVKLYPAEKKSSSRSQNQRKIGIWKSKKIIRRQSLFQNHSPATCHAKNGEFPDRELRTHRAENGKSPYHSLKLIFRSTSPLMPSTVPLSVYCQTAYS